MESQTAQGCSGSHRTSQQHQALIRSMERHPKTWKLRYLCRRPSPKLCVLWHVAPAAVLPLLQTLGHRAGAPPALQHPQSRPARWIRGLMVFRNCCSCLRGTGKNALMHLRERTWHHSELCPTFGAPLKHNTPGFPPSKPDLMEPVSSPKDPASQWISTDFDP